MLAISGTLDLYPVSGSPVARAGDGRQGLINLFREISEESQVYRSVYLPIIRDQVPESLTLFDFPDASLVSGQRDSTNVPAQSLYMMNNPQAIAAADAFAKRLSKMEVKNPQERFLKAFELAYGRLPTAEEGTAVRSFFQRFTADYTQGQIDHRTGSPTSPRRRLERLLPELVRQRGVPLFELNRRPDLPVAWSCEILF